MKLETWPVGKRLNTILFSEMFTLPFGLPYENELLLTIYTKSIVYLLP